MLSLLPKQSRKCRSRVPEAEVNNIVLVCSETEYYRRCTHAESVADSVTVTSVAAGSQFSSVTLNFTQLSLVPATTFFRTNTNITLLNTI